MFVFKFLFIISGVVYVVDYLFFLMGTAAMHRKKLRLPACWRLAGLPACQSINSTQAHNNT